MEETITITLKEYEELREATRTLNALEAAGVDNWDGYDEALSLMEENEEAESGG